MTFVLPSAQYLMTSNSNRGLVGSNTQGTKSAGNLPINTNAQQFLNTTGSSATGAISQIFFGLTSQSSTGGFDMSADSRVIVTSVQYNAPNRIQSATMANNGASIDVVSGTTENNFKRFLVGGNDTPFCSAQAGANTLCIDPTSISNDSSGGTFNDTNVSGWGWGCVRFNLSGSSSLQCFFQRVFLFQTTKDAADIPKFTGAGSDWDEAFIAVQGSNYTTTIGKWLSKVGSAFFVPCPFQFGDGSTATTFNDEGATIVSPADNATGAENFRLTNQSMRVYVSLRNNAADIVNLSGTYVWGTAAPWDFNQNDAAVININGASFSGMGNFTVGSSVSGAAIFNLNAAAQVRVNGADLDGSTVNGDCDILGSSVTTLTNLKVTGTIDFDTAGTYTIDGGSLGDVTASGGNVILNLTNGATASTATPGTGSGQVQIINTAVITVNGVVSGSRLYIEATATVGSVTSGDVVVNETVTTDPFTSNFAFEGNLSVKFWVRKATSVPFYKEFLGTGTITANGLEVNVSQDLD